MSFIIDLLETSMKEKKSIKIITQEGQASYIVEGIVLKINDIDTLVEKTSNRKKVAIKIENIIKIEE